MVSYQCKGTKTSFHTRELSRSDYFFFFDVDSCWTRSIDVGGTKRLVLTSLLIQSWKVYFRVFPLVPKRPQSYMHTGVVVLPPSRVSKLGAPLAN